MLSNFFSHISFCLKTVKIYQRIVEALFAVHTQRIKMVDLLDFATQNKRFDRSRYVRFEQLSQNKRVDGCDGSVSI